MKLSPSTIEGTLPAGRHSDGRNLYLSVSKTGSKSWVFMWMQNGRQRELGLGSFTGAGRAASVSLKQARLKADDIRLQLAKGIDPMADKQRAKALSVSFRDLLEEVIRDIVAPKSKASNREHNVNQWRRSLESHAAKIIDMQVPAITVDHVLTVLKPIWGSRKLGELVRSRIEVVLNAAKAKKLVVENVALWKGNLDGVLAPKPKKADAKNHASLAYEKLPALVARLAKREGLSAKALLSAILTGGRTSEVLLMEHAELDLDAARWTIPAARMKANKEHVVTLSTQAVELLRSVPVIEGSPFVFAGKKDGQPLSTQALRDMLNKPEAKGGMAIPSSEATPHGFRATFIDWVGEETDTDIETAEMAVAHSVKGVRAAYRRRRAEKKRVNLMQSYANYCFGVDNVVELQVAA